MRAGVGEMMAGPGAPRPELYRWRRKNTAGGKPAFNYDNVEHWRKRVEQASEFAVSEAFSNRKATERPRRAPPPALDLQTTDQLRDHDDAYTEAQELLSEWLGNKLRLELTSEEAEEPRSPPAEPPAPQFTKYNNFDDLYQYLEDETEDNNTQDFLQKLLQKEVLDSGILQDLRREEGDRKVERRDPRVTMEVRHQQVKERRARRQKELEKQKQERAVRRAAMTQAQALVQEEDRQKTLKARKEEEEIQREMVKLRKEMNERKRVAEEARRIEWKRQHQESKRMEMTPMNPGAPELDRRTRERQARIQQLLSQVYADNRRCLQKYFSAWYKLVLERRVKMGKARALADWKLQLRTFRAWQQHVWSQKLERESQKMESELRDENRKQTVAAESYRKRLLRHCLMEWQLWCRAEKEKRKLEAQKEETKRKMLALLDAASSAGGPRRNGEGRTEMIIQSPGTVEQQGEENNSASSDRRSPFPCKDTPAPKAPKHAWQVTRQHVALTSDELQPSVARRSPSPHRTCPAYGGNFENRNQFQQKMIEEQRRQLQEQKDMIQELLGNQRLMIAREEVKSASNVTAQLMSPKVTRRKENGPLTEQSSPAKHVPPRRLSFSSSRSDGPNGIPDQSGVSTAKRSSICSSTQHPALRAMEERAAQRAERKKVLEEVKRRREEDKLAQLRAAEEQKLQMEAAEREALLEKKREERRLQKTKEEEKQKRLQREKQLLDVAASHHQRALLRSRGLEPWKRLMDQSRQNMERSESLHRAALLRVALQTWRRVVTEITAEKRQRAEQLRAAILLRRSFRCWMKYKDFLSVQEMRGRRCYEANLQRKTFLAWLDLTQDGKITMWEKQRAATEHSQRRILQSALRTWRRFPERMREARLKEERLDCLRRRVTQILPDFRVGGDAPPS